MMLPQQAMNKNKRNEDKGILIWPQRLVYCRFKNESN